jgi:exopolysaccharide production protein ExoZ
MMGLGTLKADLKNAAISPRAESDRGHSTVREYARGLFELNTAGSRLLPMEGMRGMSALLVFFVHFYAVFGSRSSPALVDTFVFFGTIGHLGVDVFFALSGFIVYGILIKKPMGYFTFIWRRIVRLYPVFTTIFVVYVILELTIVHNDRLSGSLGSKVVYLAANYLMLPGFFPIVPLITVAWSLSYELFFYLALPLVVSALRLSEWPHKNRAILVTTIAIVHLALAGTGLVGHGQIVMFTCGILLYETITFRSIWSRPAWRRAGSIASLLLFGGLLVEEGLRVEPTWARYSGLVFDGQGWRLYLLFASTYALGYFALGGEGFLAKWFSRDWLRWFGNISYSYYLVHGLVLHILVKALDLIRLPQSLSSPSFLLLCGFSFLATAVGGAMLFLAVEKPFLRLRRQNSYQLRSEVESAVRA